MKRTIVLVLLCAVCLTGCGGVWMNADYSRLLDETAALSDETARRALAGQLDPNEMAAGFDRPRADRFHHRLRRRRWSITGRRPPELSAPG